MDDDADERVVATDVVNGVLAALSPREAMILRRRNGVGCRPQKLEEIGCELGLARERVRQIEQRALGTCRRMINIAA